MRAHRRTHSESHDRRPDLNDAGNKISRSGLSKSHDRTHQEKSFRKNQDPSNSSAIAEDGQYVYQRIEHKGLPRIPVEGKSPYEILQAISKDLDKAPDSAAVYVDRDSQGNAYIFFVRASDEKQDKKLNARYYRQELGKVLGTMANFIATPESGFQVPAADMMNLQALVKKPPESGDVTVGDLRETIQNLHQHVKNNRSAHLHERHSAKSTLGFTINRLNEFCAIGKADQEALCTDLCRQYTWLDKTLANSMFVEAKEAAACIISDLEETQKLDVIKLRTLQGFDKFTAFSKLWGEFQKAGSDPGNFINMENDLIPNLSQVSMAAIAGWGKEIAKLNELILSAGKNPLGKTQSVPPVTTTDNDRLNEKLRILARKSSGNASSHSGLAYSGAVSTITPRVTVAETANERKLRTLISRHTISSPRIRKDAEQAPVNPLSESEDRKMASYLSSPALIKDSSEEEGDRVDVPEAPRKQPIQLVWRRSMGTPDRTSGDASERTPSIGAVSKNISDVGSNSSMNSVMSPGTARETAANNLLEGLFADLQPEIFPDLSELSLPEGASGSVTTSWEPGETHSLLSPRDSQWMDDELLNLTSPGKPMFEFADNGNFSEFPTSPTANETPDANRQRGSEKQ